MQCPYASDASPAPHTAEKGGVFRALLITTSQVQLEQNRTHVFVAHTQAHVHARVHVRWKSVCARSTICLVEDRAWRLVLCGQGAVNKHKQVYHIPYKVHCAHTLHIIIVNVHKYFSKRSHNKNRERETPRENYLFTGGKQKHISAIGARTQMQQARVLFVSHGNKLNYTCIYVFSIELRARLCWVCVYVQHRMVLNTVRE